MINLLAKLSFLLIGLYNAQEMEAQIIIAFLLAVTISATLQYLKGANTTAIGLVLYTIICLALPPAIIFFPILVIDLFISNTHRGYLLLLIAPIFVAGSQIFWFILSISLAIICGYLLKQRQDLCSAYNALQDSHTEQSTLLLRKHNELMESHGEIASLATLQERTRIARDIHDNIGHILIRGILMVGVLKTTNKAKELIESISSIEATLKEAMDTIRKAVHDWKDEAINLNEAVQQLSTTTSFELDMQYDVSEDMPTDIKICFLMVIKEALANSSKHGNATAVKITLQEHPSLYQLLIKDNGSDKKGIKLSPGMGLSNIEERITALKGTCSFEMQNGFRIFISIPKTRS